MPQDQLEVIEGKLDALRDQLDKRQPDRSWVERHAFLVAPLLTLLIFFLGYYLKDQMDLELREQQYQLNARQAVQAHLQQLATAGVSREHRIAMAIALAEFGTLALGPLVRHLRAPGSDHRAAAGQGLRAVAELEPEATCKALMVVAAEHPHAYPVWSHGSVAGLLADLRCAGAAEALQRLETGHLAGLNPGPDLLESDIEQAREAVRKALERLESEP